MYGMRIIFNVCMPHAMGDVISCIGIAAAGSIRRLLGIVLTLAKTHASVVCFSKLACLLLVFD